MVEQVDGAVLPVVEVAGTVVLDDTAPEVVEVCSVVCVEDVLVGGTTTTLELVVTTVPAP
jgi:hypothetical protein